MSGIIRQAGFEVPSEIRPWLSVRNLWITLTHGKIRPPGFAEVTL
jgi:hypothetical protein